MLAPRLIAITDVTVLPAAPMVERLARWLARAAPATMMVQLRDRQLSGRERLPLALQLAELCQQTGQSLCVNDRLDIATLAGASAVHLPAAGLSRDQASALLVSGAWVSSPWHPPDPPPEADALLVSPVLAARKGRPPLGFSGLARARSALEGRPGVRPLLYALGGVTASNAPECLAAGADGIAAIGAVLAEPDPDPLLRALRIAR